MKIISYIIIFLLISISSYFYFSSTKNSVKDSNGFLIKLPTYKLENGKYVTSIQYVDYENKLKIIIYGRGDVTFSSCIVKYKALSELCNASLIYRGGYSLLRIMEVDTKEGYSPQFLLLNNITLNIPKSKRNNKYKFVSCYAVMSNFDRPLLLTQLIESNIHFGVSKMVFYYFSASEKVKKVLKYYSNIGVADVYQFQTDSFLNHVESSREIQYYHLIFFKLNHCFYEYKTKTNHMLFLDLDEILWPIKAKNYEELIESIPSREFYFIHSSFFKPEFDIPQQFDKSEKIILPDVNIFSIKKYCLSNDGYTHKYIMINASSFVAAEIHDPFPINNIIREYLSNDVAYIRHTRHFDIGLKNHCPTLLDKNLTEIEKYIRDKSDRIMKSIFR